MRNDVVGVIGVCRPSNCNMGYSLFRSVIEGFAVGKRYPSEVRQTIKHCRMYKGSLGPFST